MSLVLGDGPFAKKRAGTSADPLPEHALYMRPVGRRIRGEIGGRTVVRSDDAQVLFETGEFPARYVPRGDIEPGLLRDNGRRETDPHKGEAAFADLIAGGRRVENAAWSFPRPGPHAPAGLAGLVALDNGALDRWFEEDEELLGHPRDPYHRVDTRRSTRTVEVRLSGELLARSTRPVGVFETSLPVRWYLPRTDVAVELSRTDTAPICPYKGVSTYWSYGPHKDIAWSYEQPLGEAHAVRSHMSFDGPGVDVSVSG